MKIERTYVWTRGRKRRATEYEDVTAFFSTPAVPFLPEQQSHPVASPIPWHFTNTRIGPPTLDRSRLQYEAWERFADPDQMHYVKYVNEQWRKEQEVNAALRAGKSIGVDLPADWVEFLRTRLSPLRYLKWSGVPALQYVIRFVPSSPVDAASAFQAFDELRATQRIIRHASDLHETHGGFDGQRDLWLNDPAWQPAREFAERLNTVKDWGEILVALNLCLKPIVEPFVAEIARSAALNGDIGTASMLQSLLSDGTRHRRWSDAFTTLLLNSPQFGEGNRAVMEEWLRLWYPRALAILQGLSAELDSVERKAVSAAAFEDDLISNQYPSLLKRLGFDMPDQAAADHTTANLAAAK